MAEGPQAVGALALPHPAVCSCLRGPLESFAQLQDCPRLYIAATWGLDGKGQVWRRMKQTTFPGLHSLLRSDWLIIGQFHSDATLGYHVLGL